MIYGFINNIYAIYIKTIIHSNYLHLFIIPKLFHVTSSFTSV